jgi:hypothetical protein
MERLSIVSKDVLYITEVGETGAPTIIVTGRPAEIPKAIYREAASGIGPNTFTCQRCHAAVASLLISGKGWQTCRCMVVQHHCYPEKEVYQDSETWEEFRQTYEREALDPAPIESGPYSKKSRNFLTRKLRFHHPVEISLDGRLVKTEGGSIYIDPKADSISLNADLEKLSSEELEDLARAYQLKTSGGSPSTFIVVGDDPDYVFPPETRNIRPLSFDCPNCKMKVRQGGLDYPDFERILCCYCMSVYVRKGVLGPRSSADWQSARDAWFKSRVKHQAAAADGRS